MTPPALLAATAGLDAISLLNFGIELIVVFVGVFFAQRFADRAARRAQAEDEQQNLRFVRGAVTSALCQSFISIRRHQQIVNTTGTPPRVGLLNATGVVDSYRATQAIGEQAYGKLLAVHGTIDLADRYLSTLHTEYALAYYSQRNPSMEPKLFASGFYKAHLAELSPILADIERPIREILRELDPGRLAQIEEAMKERFQE